MPSVAAADRLLVDRARTARALGSRADLVLDGGGNASVQTAAEGGGPDALLWVTPSGADLGSMQPGGFVPLDLAAVRELQAGPALDEHGLVAALAAVKLRASDPAPSIESLLHGWFPARFVDHSHAAAVQALANTVDGEEHLRRALSSALPVVPALPSGDPLARAAADALAAAGTPPAGAAVLMHHGVVTWGPTADACWAEHLRVVECADEYLRQAGAPEPHPVLASSASDANAAAVQATLHLLHERTPLQWLEVPVDPKYFALKDAESRAGAGPVTPGDLLRLGISPVWRDSGELEIGPAFDPETRSCLCPDLAAAFVAGEHFDAARAAAAVLEQDLATRLRGSALGAWRSLDEAARRAAKESFLEQAKFSRAQDRRP